MTSVAAFGATKRAWKSTTSARVRCFRVLAVPALGRLARSVGSNGISYGVPSSGNRARTNVVGLSPVLAHVIASVHLVAVRDIKQHGALRIQQLKGASEYVQAGDNAVGLGDKLHRGGTRRGAHARRAHVLKRNVLAQSLQNQIIDDELHGNGIHGLLLHGLRAGGTGQIIDCQRVGAQGAMTAIERGIARLLHCERLAGAHVPRGATTPDQRLEQAV